MHSRPTNHSSNSLPHRQLHHVQASHHLSILVKLIVVFNLFIFATCEATFLPDSNDGANTEITLDPSGTSKQESSASQSTGQATVTSTPMVTSFLDDNNEPLTSSTVLDTNTLKPFSNQSSSLNSSSIPSTSFDPPKLLSTSTPISTVSLQPSSVTRTTTSNGTSHMQTAEEEEEKPTSSQSISYIHEDQVSKENVISVELKTDLFNVLLWVQEKSKIFTEIIVNHAASTSQMKPESLQLFFVHPTPEIFLDRSIIRFCLKNSQDFLNATDIAKNKTDLTKAIEKRLNVTSVKLWCGTDRNRSHRFMSSSSPILSLALISLASVSSILILVTAVMVTLIYCRTDDAKPMKPTSMREGAPEFDAIKPNRTFHGNVNNGFDISASEFPSPPVQRTADSFMDASVAPYSERFYAEPNRISDAYRQPNTMDTRL